MPSDLRVVFDTNTLISAFLLPESIPRQALDSATAAGQLLFSPATATELTEVLRQPKFDRYLAQHRRMTLLAVLIHYADLVEVDVTVTDCRDSHGEARRRPIADRYPLLGGGSGAPDAAPGRSKRR